MGLARAGHGNGVGLILQAVVGLVLNGVAGGLLNHLGIEATALDHEAIDHPMKNGAVEVAILHVGDEVLNGLGGFLGIEPKGDATHAGLEFNHGDSFA